MLQEHLDQLGQLVHEVLQVPPALLERLELQEALVLLELLGFKEPQVP